MLFLPWLTIVLHRITKEKLRFSGGVPGSRRCTWSWGMYLVQGGEPGPGGCTWSQGVYLVLGGVPGPRGKGCTWFWGCTWSRGCTWSWGVYLVWGMYLVWEGCTWAGTPPLSTESQIPVKTQPCPNFVAGGKNCARLWTMQKTSNETKFELIYC